MFLEIQGESFRLDDILEGTCVSIAWEILSLKVHQSSSTEEEFVDIIC